MLGTLHTHTPPSGMADELMNRAPTNRSQGKRPTVHAWIIGVFTAVVIATAGPFFMSASSADDPPIPPIKTTPPSIGASDPDDFAGSSAYPIVSPAPDGTANASQITALKAALPGILQRYNAVQEMSTDTATRISQAAAIKSDVDSAASRGAMAFMSESTAMDAGTGPAVSSFRDAMSNTFDVSVLVGQAQAIANEMVLDANDVNAASMVSSTFTVLTWQGVTVTGGPIAPYVGTATVLGQYTNCFQGGVVGGTPDCETSDPTQYKLTLKRYSGLVYARQGYPMTWVIVSMAGNDAADAFPTALPTPGDSAS
jgi:hypothetical protein